MTFFALAATRQAQRIHIKRNYIKPWTRTPSTGRPPAWVLPTLCSALPPMDNFLPLRLSSVFLRLSCMACRLKRPLPPEAIAYAQQDVAKLLLVHRNFVAAFSERTLQVVPTKRVGIGGKEFMADGARTLWRGRELAWLRRSAAAAAGSTW